MSREQTEECPFCGETFSPQGLDGHVRLAHGGDPEVKRWLQRRRRIRRLEAAREKIKMGTLTADYPVLLEAAETCYQVAEQEREKGRQR